MLQKELLKADTQVIFPCHQTWAVYKELKEIILSFYPELGYEMALWLTSPSSYFGIILCGGCGNGKSTMLKAQPCHQLYSILKEEVKQLL